MGCNPVSATDPTGSWPCFLSLDCISNSIGDLFDQASNAFAGDPGGFGGGSGGGGNIVTFSQDQYGVDHGYRHVIDAGLSGVLSQSAIESAITADLQPVALGVGENYNSTVYIGEQPIYHRSYGIGPGQINVETYWPL